MALDPSTLLEIRVNTLLQDAVVDEHSGCLDGFPKLGLACDHFRLNKFTNADDRNYRLVCEEIVRFVEGAPARISSRRPGDHYISASTR